MQLYIFIGQLVISIALILVILLQVKGGSGLGSIFGQSDTVYRTKRGVEKTLFQLTIVLTVLFIALSILALKVA